MVHQSRRWGAVGADHVSRTGLHRQETRICCDRHLLLMNLQGQAQRGEDFINGKRLPFNLRTPGALTFIPAGAEWSGWDDGDASASYLMVSIEDEFIRRVLTGKDSESPDILRPRIGFRDRVVEQALKDVLTEVQRPDTAGQTFVEAAATRIAVQLYRLEGREFQKQGPGLSPYRVKKIIEMIEANPFAPPTLFEMAAEIGIDAVYLRRAFKLSTGVTPYGYFRQRRLERAADLVKDTRMSITQVASQCGFSTPSHLASAFRDAFGLTPREYRRCWNVLLR